MYSKLIYFILVTLFISTQCIVDDQWHVVRYGADNVGYRLERAMFENNVQLVSIAAAESLQHIVACTQSGIAVYRVLMYPNLYTTHASHLFYGAALASSNLTWCTISADQSHLLSLDSVGNLVVRRRLFLRNVALRRGAGGMVAEEAFGAIHFSLAHPRDNYPDVWVQRPHMKRNEHILRVADPLDYYERVTQTERQAADRRMRLSAFDTQSRIRMAALSADSMHMATLSLTEADINVQTRYVGERTRTRRLPVGTKLSGRRVALAFGNERTLRSTIVLVAVAERGGSKVSFFAFVYNVDADEWRSLKVRSTLKCDSFQMRLIPLRSDANETPSFLFECKLLTLYSLRVRIDDNRLLLSVEHAVPLRRMDVHTVTVSHDTRVLLVHHSNGSASLCDAHKLSMRSCTPLRSDERLVPPVALLYSMRHHYIVGAIARNASSTGLGVLASSTPNVVSADTSLSLSDSFYLPRSLDESDLLVDGLVGNYVLLLQPLVALFILHHFRHTIDAFGSTVLGFAPALLTRVFDSTSVPFYAASVGIALFSTFEIVAEPAFLNDWPAHMHHVEQFVDPAPPPPIDNMADGNSSALESDYARFMHYHGPCTYPGAFLLFYTLIYYATAYATLWQHQALWAALELTCAYTVHAIGARLGAPRWLPLLPLLSNRLHLYNVRVLINDTLTVALVLLCMLVLLCGVSGWKTSMSTKMRLCASALLFSLALGTKLNVLFYAPAFALLFLDGSAGVSALLFSAIVAAVQVALMAPFEPYAYVRNAFDVSRRLLWEKTRNFKWLGRALYEEERTHQLLLLLTAACVARILYCQYRQYCRSPSTFDAYRHVVIAMIQCNFACIVFARGLYTPFMCWYFYTFGLLCYVSNVTDTLCVILFVAHEILFRFFKDAFVEQLCGYVWFCTNVYVIAHCLELVGERHRVQRVDKEKKQQ